MKPTLRISMVVSRLLIAGGVFVLGSMARADGTDSNEGSCSNRTLRGDYGFTIEGQLLLGPNAGLVRGVAMTHFDGRGNLTQVDHVLDHGVPPVTEWTPATGTYTVNPDCTGKSQLLFNDGRPPINMNFVVVRQGKEIRTVVSNAGSAVSSVGTKVE
jgi:hypothetical protein